MKAHCPLPNSSHLHHLRYARVAFPPVSFWGRPKPALCFNPSTLFGLVCSQYSCCQSLGNRMCVLRYDQDIRPLSHLFRKMVGWWGPWNSEYIKTHGCQVWCLAGWPLFVMYFWKHRLGWNSVKFLQLLLKAQWVLRLIRITQFSR